MDRKLSNDHEGVGDEDIYQVHDAPINTGGSTQIRGHRSDSTRLDTNDASLHYQQQNLYQMPSYAENHAPLEYSRPINSMSPMEMHTYHTRGQFIAPVNEPMARNLSRKCTASKEHYDEHTSASNGRLLSDSLMMPFETINYESTISPQQLWGPASRVMGARGTGVSKIQDDAHLHVNRSSPLSANQLPGRATYEDSFAHDLGCLQEGTAGHTIGHEGPDARASHESTRMAADARTGDYYTMVLVEPMQWPANSLKEWDEEEENPSPDQGDAAEETSSGKIESPHKRSKQAKLHQDNKENDTTRGEEHSHHQSYDNESLEGEGVDSERNNVDDKRRISTPIHASSFASIPKTKESDDLDEACYTSRRTESKRAQLSNEQRNLIVQLHSQGRSLREIAKRIKCTLSAVQYTVKKFARFQTVENLPKCGRTPLMSTMSNDEFFGIFNSIQASTSRERLGIAAKKLSEVIGHRPSHKTIYKEWKNRCHDMGKSTAVFRHSSGKEVSTQYSSSASSSEQEE